MQRGRLSSQIRRGRHVQSLLRLHNLTHLLRPRLEDLDHSVQAEGLMIVAVLVLGVLLGILLTRPIWYPFSVTNQERHGSDANLEENIIMTNHPQEGT